MSEEFNTTGKKNSTKGKITLIVVAITTTILGYSMADQADLFRGLLIMKKSASDINKCTYTDGYLSGIADGYKAGYSDNKKGEKYGKTLVKLLSEKEVPCQNNKDVKDKELDAKELKIIFQTMEAAPNIKK